MWNVYIFKLIIPLRHASLARQHQGHDWTYNMNGSELSILKHSDLKTLILYIVNVHSKEKFIL